VGGTTRYGRHRVAGDETIVLPFHGDTHAPLGWRSLGDAARAAGQFGHCAVEHGGGALSVRCELKLRLIRREMFRVLVAVRESTPAGESDNGEDQVWDEENDAEACER